jgi:threonylcarbamoyladenosine tRNA methylthiotransferase MtaB
MMRLTRRASVYTVGCRLNQSESAVLADRLKAGGYRLVDPGQPTDLFVLNTCSVTEEAEDTCRYLIRRTLRASPEAFVAVTGCYAQTGADTLSRLEGVDLIVGNEFKMRLPEFLPPPDQLHKRPAPELLHAKRLDREDFAVAGVGDYDATRANLKIQDGCDVMCSFCLIPFARGHERSREFDDALREARALANRGHRELVLTGVNVGQYRHQGHTLVDLIRSLESIESVDRIRISSIEPTTISPELLDHMAASKKLCRHLHIPLQSGDDEILIAMNRPYRVDQYVALIERAMGAMPDLGLGTDVMVGFPGEGERHFANTRALAVTLPFSYFHVFPYSERPGTAATRLPERVGQETLARRVKDLADISRSKRLAFAQRHVGKQVETLFEHRREQGYWTGLTANYLRVGVALPRSPKNQMRSVTISGVMDGLALGTITDSAASI